MGWGQGYVAKFLDYQSLPVIYVGYNYINSQASLIPKVPLRSQCCAENLGEPGDEASPTPLCFQHGNTEMHGTGLG